MNATITVITAKIIGKIILWIPSMIKKKQIIKTIVAPNLAKYLVIIVPIIPKRIKNKTKEKRLGSVKE